MPPPTRFKQSSSLPDLDWLVTDDGSRTLWDSNLNETYHSGCGAVAESLIVYLRNSGVLGRLVENKPTRVFELGFGTGTAFLLTAALAEKLSTPVEYWAIDIRLLPAQFVNQLELQAHINKVLEENFVTSNSLPRATDDEIITANDLSLLPQVTARLAEELEKVGKVPEVLPSTLSLSLGQFCRLHLIVGDMTKVDIERDYPELVSHFDAIYFDAFSPETCPELWTSNVLIQMSKLLVRDGVLTSYCVKSIVRKALEAAGFAVTRLSGPVGGKREVLKAVRT